MKSILQRIQTNLLNNRPRTLVLLAVLGIGAIVSAYTLQQTVINTQPRAADTPRCEEITLKTPIKIGDPLPGIGSNTFLTKSECIAQRDKITQAAANQNCTLFTKEGCPADRCAWNGDACVPKTESPQCETIYALQECNQQPGCVWGKDRGDNTFACIPCDSARQHCGSEPIRLWVRRNNVPVNP